MKISKDLLCHFEDFMEIVPPGRLRKDLLKLFFSYLKNELKVGVGDSFPSMVEDFEALFDFIDAIESYKVQADC